MQSMVSGALELALQNVAYAFDTNNGLGFTATTVASNPTITIAGTTAAAELQLGYVVHSSADSALVGDKIIALAVVSGNTEVTLSGNATASASGVAITFLEQGMVHLAQAPWTPGPPTTPGSFTEATFDGYLPKHTNWEPKTPYIDPLGNAQVDSDLLAWVLTAAPTVPNVIVGYYVLITLGTSLQVVLYEPLPNLPMLKAGDAVVISVPLTLPSAGSASVIG